MSASAQVFTFGIESGWPKEVIIYTDGASRGNPGAASMGITVTDSNEEVVYEYAETLGTQTNNFAEYAAVRKALEMAVANQVETLTLRSDSQLLIRQLTGEYRVKAEGLKALFKECVQFASNISHVTFEHVRRENNKRADELANIVLDRF